MDSKPGPTTAQVTRALRERMISGQWRPGQRVATEKELAQEFDVSAATVQRSMRELEKAGLIRGRRGSGRFVSEQVPSRRTNEITLVIAEPGHMFHPALVAVGRGVSTVAEQRGYHLKYWAIHAGASRFDDSNSPDWTRLLQAEQTDGIIVATQRISPDALAQASTRFPVVWLHPIARPPRLTSVVLDYLGGAFQAARYLADLGHRRIALLTTPAVDPIAQTQIDGARLALMDLARRDGAQLDVLRAPAACIEGGRELGRQWLSASVSERSTAVIGGADELALGFYQAVDDAGLRIPGDVSLIGWNDFITGAQVPVAMTSVHVHYEEAGRRCAERLTRMIESPGGAALEPELVACDLIARDSTAPP